MCGSTKKCAFGLENPTFWVQSGKSPKCTESRAENNDRCTDRNTRSRNFSQIISEAKNIDRNLIVSNKKKTKSRSTSVKVKKRVSLRGNCGGEVTCLGLSPNFYQFFFTAVLMAMSSGDRP